MSSEIPNSIDIWLAWRYTDLKALRLGKVSGILFQWHSTSVPKFFWLVKSSILKHVYTYIRHMQIFWQDIGVEQLDKYNVAINSPRQSLQTCINWTKPLINTSTHTEGLACGNTWLWLNHNFWATLWCVMCACTETCIVPTNDNLG